MNKKTETKKKKQFLKALKKEYQNIGEEMKNYRAYVLTYLNGAIIDLLFIHDKNVMKARMELVEFTLSLEKKYKKL